MKKNEQFLALPIISITEGRELGVSKSLLIDAENGKVAAIIIEDEDWYRGVKLLPYESVVAIGDDAVTITSSEDILNLEDATDFETFLDQNIRVIGTKAITKGGTIQGVVSNLFIDDDGSIAKVVLNAQDGQEKEVDSENISIFGKEVTIIESDVPAKKNNAEAEIAEKKTKEKPVETVIEAKVPEKAADMPTEPAKQEQPAVKKTEEQVKAPEVEKKPVEEVKSANKKAEEVKPAPKEEIKKAAEASTENANSAPVGQETPSVTTSSAEDRHRRFLLGKKATRRIATDNGIVIAEEGADITEEVLQKAKLANKFIELSMNVK